MSFQPAPDEGDIWNVDLSPTIGREQSGRRPALIISNSGFNSLPNGLVVVVPLTTTTRRLPHFYEVRPPEGGLRAISYAICDQPRSISIERLVDRRGRASGPTLHAVRHLISLFIGN